MGAFPVSAVVRGMLLLVLCNVYADSVCAAAVFVLLL